MKYKYYIVYMYVLHRNDNNYGSMFADLNNKIEGSEQYDIVIDLIRRSFNIDKSIQILITNFIFIKEINN